MDFALSLSLSLSDNYKTRVVSVLASLRIWMGTWVGADSGLLLAHCTKPSGASTSVSARACFCGTGFSK